jgi:hypothetical protein
VFPLRVCCGCWLGLAPRFSSTSVATWTWQEKLAEVHKWNRVHRLNSWIEFLSAPIHSPPLWFAVSVLQQLCWHNCSDAIHQCTVGSSGAEDPMVKSSLLASTQPSDRPTLSLTQGVSSSSAEEFVLARLCLVQTWSSDRPMVLSNGPSIHPVLVSSWLQLCNSSDASRILTVGSSDGVNFISASVQCTMCSDAITPMILSVHLTVCFSFFFFVSSSWIFSST